jgi:PAS domain S-box-containing protein
MDRLLREKSTLVLRCAVAIATVAIALAGKLLLLPILTLESPFLLFFAAIMVSSLYGGMTGGILATFLAALSSNFFFLPPSYTFTHDPRQLLRMILFIVEGVCISGVIAALRSARQQIRAGQAELSQSQARYRSLLESMQDPILRSFFDSAAMMMGIVELVSDEEVLHLAENAASAAFFGRTPEQTRNQLASDMGVPPEHIRYWVQQYREAERTRAPVRFEYCHSTAAGERWLSATVCLVLSSAGSRPRFAYIVEDISERARLEAERKQAEAEILQLNAALELRVAERTAELLVTNQQLATEINERNRTLEELQQVEVALRQSEERFRVALQHSPIVVLNQDTNLRYTWVYNPKLGYGVEEILGKTDAELTPLAARQLESIKRQVLATGAGVRQEVSITSNEETFYFDLSVEPHRNSDGEIIGITAAAIDVTERKRLLQQEQAIRLELEAANRMKDQFLSTLSHELRTPLNSILGWAKLLPSHKLDATTTLRALEAIARNTTTLAQLIEDVLDTSRIITGNFHLKVDTVALEPLIDAAIASVQTAAAAKGIHIDRHLDSDVPPLQGDASRLQQVVWNILSNAIKFTPQGGSVIVSLERVIGNGSSVIGAEPEHLPQPPTPLPHYAQLTITDTGKGISPNFLPYAFDRFRQEDGSTTRTYGGLGLGLAIVRHIVELHGGTVRVDSPGEDQGSTFTVLLPLEGGDGGWGEVLPDT